MLESPLVSVIIPVYNGEKYLKDAINSAFQQSYRPIEVIIVDDGSTDGSSDIAQAFHDVNYIFQTNQGNAIARNNGINSARGDFIAFLDQDDLWVPEKLSLQMDYLLQHPETDYVLANKRYILEKGNEYPSWLREELRETDQMAFSPGVLLARKSLFKKIGYFDPSYKTASDFDWFFRAKDANIPMYMLPEVMLLKRVHGDNQSYQVQTLHSEYLKVIRASIQRQREVNK